MPVSFEFATANRILFGWGRAADAPGLARSLGDRVFLVHGHSYGRVATIAAAICEAGCFMETCSIGGEPTIADVACAAERARSSESNVVVGFGGGSVIDAAKAIAALATNYGEPLDYLEVIGAGRPLAEQPAPCLAIPTTAGTGAEVTRNAVLGSPEHAVKVSMRHATMLPDIALVDPELTVSVPPDVTALTGLDALTQCLESYVTHLANPLTDGICREGLAHAGRCLRRAVEEGTDREARTGMAVASLFGGLALANAKLGAVHGFAGPLGGMFPAPHGGVCARMLPPVMEVNLRALRARDAGSPAVGRYAEVARCLTGRADAKADDGVAWVRDLVAELDVPGLGKYGMQSADIGEVLPKVAESSSMKGNPITLTDEELTEIFERSL